MKKLVNKATGQVGVLGIHNEEFWVDVSGTSANSYSLPEPGSIIRYSSLPELASEWKDYEEPKGIQKIHKHGNDIVIRMVSEEEADKAVEKLKAWKRLEDKGFRFVGITETSIGIDCAEFEIGKDFYKERSVRNSELNKDLDLLFGGEGE